jgi:hypothetical protein
MQTGKGFVDIKRRRTADDLQRVAVWQVGCFDYNLRLGLFSRQDAKNAKYGFIFFLCGLCGLCAFARDILAFGCGSATLGQGRY